MQKPPDGWPRIAPSLFYEDAAAAIDWLVNAFGFEVQVRVENERGQIVHSQLVMNGGLVMVGQAGLSPDRPYCKSPRGVDGAEHAGAGRLRGRRRRPLRARPGGGRRVIVTEPSTQDYGEDYWADRTYQARDPEGHHWWFMQRLRG